jgi:uncharacterized membrane protein YhaH (DUF805 family)
VSYQWPQSVPHGSTVPLWAPYYGAPIGEAIRRFFKKYATFTGRASRSEFWWWVLISGAVGFIINVVISTAGTTVSDPGANIPGPGATVGLFLAVIWGLATIVPSLALTVRRLHDVNMSGWMILIELVPILGGLAILIITILPSRPEGQRFDIPD